MINRGGSMRTTGVAPIDCQQGTKSCNCKKSNCLKVTHFI